MYDTALRNKKEELEGVRNIKKTLAMTLFASGVLLLMTQIIPLGFSYLNGYIETYKQKSLKGPMSAESREELFAESVYDPGVSYFRNLIKNAELDNVQNEDVVNQKLGSIKIDETYSSPMRITMDSLGIKDIQITPNVNSFVESEYNKALKFGLAHFRGTPIPGDGGNSFIYGHSSVQSFFQANRNSPEIVFSKLEEAKIGQTVIIERDGSKIEYKIRSRKIIEPTDFSVLSSQPNKETVTLMTCWPLGVGTKRLIVVAERYE